ncbi:preprotein translocase subunit SecA [Psychromonas sp. SP041]|uniref:preprotein translocase subunit SecA n=1 Tax=Psychromonas sp. SP041 TaxID=1365007 RepID=UPI0010C79F56|nr:preprotein translocase subunit SecA [Psychromonas sp. SP041]
MKKLINSYSHNKTHKQLFKLVKKIKSIENLTIEKIKAGKTYPQFTQEFKDRISSGETLDAILPEAFSLCQAASLDVMGMKHYDVQLMGGVSIHKGSVAEIKTGEGKTLVATLPAYLNSLSGNQVHIVTVNDYLAKRDAEIMRPLYEALGLTVGHVESKMETNERIANYKSDILYATSSELGFDYLRDNMAMNKNELLQKKGLNFAIVDEIDSILIDDARTPLIISGQADLNEKIPLFMNKIVRDFSVHWWNDKNDIELFDVKEDIIINEKKQDAKLSESGFIKLEEALVKNNIIASEKELYSPQNLMLVDALTTAARSAYLYKKEIHYIVSSDQKIQIINQSTGRLESSRRWSGGLHQSIEAKEGVQINPDSQTLGSVSLQNFFRLYDKLSGMSGTAQSEREEFESTYGIGVVIIPTHKPIIRKDYADEIFLTQEAKINAIVLKIKEKRKVMQPILVGTSSVEESDEISQKLNNLSISHRVLNAKSHALEAEIISEAGRPGSITIATNMAGRGTDILLGGNLGDMIANSSDPTDDKAVEMIKMSWKSINKKVLELGGLYVIGTSRNDSRRVDDQLIGRAGRQGDPGASKFFISFDDKIMRLFGDGKYTSAIKALGLTDDEGLSHPLISKAVRSSQAKIDAQHSSMRKELLKFDNITNSQRMAIYDYRQYVLSSNDSWKDVYRLTSDVFLVLKNKFLPSDSMLEMWDIQGMQAALYEYFDIEFDLIAICNNDEYRDEEVIYELLEKLIKSTINNWAFKVDEKLRESISKQALLVSIDSQWREQITDLEQLREGIHLRGYAQKEPLQEFGKDALVLFEMMTKEIKASFVKTCFLAFPDQIREEEAELNKITEKFKIED